MRAARILSSVAAALLAGACAAASVVEVPVETPIKPKLDASAFDRVYVAGFVAGGEEDVDANIETVRLLRSQLKNKASLRVIEADVLPLMDAAAGAREAGAATAPPAPALIREEKDLEPYEKVFERKDYWKKIGDEYQGPLIVTGSVIFVPHQRSGYVQREQETYDAFGRRSVVPTRTYMDRKGYILKPKFIFIDGRTGETLHTETFREEVLYNAEQSTPALSAYFELMDRLLPSFLATLSSQSIKGTRVLIR